MAWKWQQQPSMPKYYLCGVAEQTAEPAVRAAAAGKSPNIFIFRISSREHSVGDELLVNRKQWTKITKPCEKHGELKPRKESKEQNIV